MLCHRIRRYPWSNSCNVVLFVGIHEALELRDKDKAKWHGQSVLKAVANVNDIIAPAIVDKEMDPVDQVITTALLFNVP